MTMPLITIPNFSEGRDEATIHRCVAAVRTCARVLHVHSDPIHNRTVVTATDDDDDSLSEAMVRLAEAPQRST